MKTIVEISECFPNKHKPYTGEFIYRHSKALSAHCKVIVIVPLRFIPGRELLSGNPNKIMINLNNWLQDIRQTSDITEGNLDVIFFGYISLPRPFFESSDTSFLSFFFYNKLKNLITEQKPDLLYCNWIRPWAPIVSDISQEIDVPFVIDHHEDIPTLKELYPQKYSGFLKVFEKAEKIIVHSSVNKKQLLAERLKIPDVKVIHLGQNFDVSDTNRSFDKKKFKLICVSHLTEPRKNVDVLIRAFSFLDKNKFTLTIVGDGTLKNDYVTLAKSLKLSGSVFFKGAMSQKEIETELENSDIFILPSFPEAFGIVLTEALAKGLPVISCKGNGGAEELKSLGYPVILVKPDDVNELSEAITKLSSDTELMNAMSKSGMKTVSKYFTWEKNGLNTFKYLEETVNEYSG
ncbi:MAG: glycosyltransferase family 4 protein [Ignavibacteria bacterium]|nr:glycosyltransferase family 4 protein [Ignavibacteria bacterium]